MAKEFKEGYSFVKSGWSTFSSLTIGSSLREEGSFFFYVLNPKFITEFTALAVKPI